MGFIFSKHKKEIRILFLGIERAGKTTALYQLKLNQTVSTLSTVGFNLESIKHHKVTFTIWDVGGKQVIRPLWKHYYEDCQAVIYFIDSSDIGRIQETTNELRVILRDLDLKGLPLAIIANKQDISGALTAKELREEMKLGVITDRDWDIFETSATTGKGLYDVLDWLLNHVEH